MEKKEHSGCVAARRLPFNLLIQSTQDQLALAAARISHEGEAAVQPANSEYTGPPKGTQESGHEGEAQFNLPIQEYTGKAQRHGSRKLVTKAALSSARQSRVPLGVNST